MDDIKAGVMERTMSKIRQLKSEVAVCILRAPLTAGGAYDTVRTSGLPRQIPSTPDTLWQLAGKVGPGRLSQNTRSLKRSWLKNSRDLRGAQSGTIAPHTINTNVVEQDPMLDVGKGNKAMLCREDFA